jgi:integrase/recombinase XerD
MSTYQQHRTPVARSTAATTPTPGNQLSAVPATTTPVASRQIAVPPPLATISSAPVSAPAPTSQREAFQQYLTVTQRSPKTIEHYINAIEQFHTFLKCKNPLHADLNDIRAFLFHLIHERELASRTYNQYLYGLKAFYEGFMPDVPIMQPFTRHKVRDGNITIVTRYEFERMLTHTENIKHKAVLVLLYSSGIRAFECAAIKITDFDPEQMLIHLQGKGGTFRYTVFSQRCRETLREYIRMHRPVTYLFPGRNKETISTEMIGHIVREAARRISLAKDVSPHILRHSFATHFLETDGRLPVLQSMLGHLNPKTTYRYCHVDTALLRTVTSPLDVDLDRFGPQPKADRKRQGGKQ